MVHREVLSQSVRLLIVVLARQKIEDRSHEETLNQERCARQAAWDLARNIYKLKNSDRTTFCTPIEDREHKEMIMAPAAAFVKKTRGARI